MLSFYFDPVHTRIQPSFINQQQEQEAETRTDYTQFTTTVISDAFEWEDKVSFVSSKWKMDGRWDMRNWRSARARECCFSAKCQKLENCLFVISPLNFILGERERVRQENGVKICKMSNALFQMVCFPQMFKNNFQKSANNLKDLCKKTSDIKVSAGTIFLKGTPLLKQMIRIFQKSLI